MNSEERSPKGNPPILLRQKRTGLYYAIAGGWTAHAEKAKDFGDLLAAQKFGGECGVSDLEIVVRANPGEFCIPVTDLR